MATDKPRFSLTIEESLLSRIQDYKARNNFSTQSKAIAALVLRALDEMDMAETETAPNGAGERAVSGEERRLLELWRRADGIDKQTIWNILSRYDEEGRAAVSSCG